MSYLTVKKACERYLSRLHEYENAHFIQITVGDNEQEEARARRRMNKALARLIAIAEKRGREEAHHYVEDDGHCSGCDDRNAEQQARLEARTEAAEAQRDALKAALEKYGHD